MKNFDESLVEVKILGEPYLGNTLSISATLREDFNFELLKLSRKELAKRLNVETEWIVFDSGDPNSSECLKGTELRLSDEFLAKSIKIHATPRIEGMNFVGMPTQTQLGPINPEPGALAEAFDAAANGKPLVGEKGSRVLNLIASNLCEWAADPRRKRALNRDNLLMAYDLYNSEKTLENETRKAKNAAEERLFWQGESQKFAQEAENFKDQLASLKAEFSSIKAQNDILLEEKNFLVSARFMRPIEQSFLEDKSEPIAFHPPIPLNNTLEFTMLEDENAFESSRETKLLREKLALAERANRALAADVADLKRLYCENSIEKMQAETQLLKLQNASLQSELKSYKSQLHTIDFNYRYVVKELESLKSFGSLVRGSSGEENFMMATGVIQSLTKEIFNKDAKIQELLNTVTQLRSEYAHNQTF